MTDLGESTCSSSSPFEKLEAEFRCAATSGTRPDLQAFLDRLPVNDPCRRDLLFRLIPIDLEWRWNWQQSAADVSDRPDTFRLEDYAKKWPELLPLEVASEALIELVVEEYLARCHRTPVPAIESYRDRFLNLWPNLEGKLRLACDAFESERGQADSEGFVPPEVPGYEIVGEVGRGGMGVVYKARQLNLNRVVALKMILSGAHAGSVERERFKREAESVAALQNPHIVQIFDIGEANGHPYLALEFVDGGSLAQQLSGEPWAPNRAAELVEVLARTMQFAHDAGIVHRDLKPGNILLSAERGAQSAEPKAEEPRSSVLRSEFRAPSSALQPKVTDFGLAKRLGETLDGNGGTRTGAVMGTPSYIAPEQASGRTRDVGSAADVYALGAILYELLTGRPPFRGETSLDTVLQVLHDDPVPPKRLNPVVPRDLETICLKCLSKSPGKRYADADALAADLRRFLNGEPIHARPLSAWGRGAKWAKRHPALTVLFGVTATALLALVAVLSVAYARVTSEYQRAEGEAKEARQARDGEKAEREKAVREAEEARKARDGENTARQQADVKAEEARQARDREKAEREKAEKLAAENEKAKLLAEDDRHGTLLAMAYRAAGANDIATAEQILNGIKGEARNNPETRFVEAFIQRQVSPMFGGILPPGPTHTTQIRFANGGRVFGCVIGYGTDAPQTDQPRFLKVYTTEAPADRPPVEKLSLSYSAKYSPHTLSPDGSRVATTCSDGTLHVWDAANGERIAKLTTQLNLRGGRCLNGGKVVAWTDDGDFISWSVADSDFRRVGKTGLPSTGGWTVDWVSRDGRRVAVHVPNGTWLWDFETGNGVLLSTEGKYSFPRGVRPSPSDKHLVGLTSEGAVAVVAVEGAKVLPLRPPPGKGERISDAWFITDDLVALIVVHNSGDQMAEVWKVGNTKPQSTRQLPRDVRREKESRRFVLALPDENPNVIEVVDLLLQNAEPVRLPISPASVVEVTSALNGEVFALAYADGRIELRGASDGTVRNSTMVAPAMNGGLEFSDDGGRVLVRSRTRVQVWAPGGPKPTVTFPTDQSVTAWALSQDGARAVIGHADGSVAVWNLQNGTPLAPRMDHGEPITVVRCESGGQFITAGTNGGLKLWDATGKKLSEARVPVEPSRLNAFIGAAGGLAIGLPESVFRPTLVDVRFSGNGKHLIVHTTHGVTLLGATKLDVLPAGPAQGRASPPSWDTSGRLVAANAEGATGQIWDTNTGLKCPPLSRFSSEATSACVCDSVAAFASADGTVRLVEFPGGAELATIEFGEPVYEIRLFDGGKRVVLIGAEKVEAWATNLSAPQDNNVARQVAEKTRTARIAVRQGATGDAARMRERRSTVSISPNGSRLAIWQDRSNALDLWDLREGKHLATLTGHSSPLTESMFLNDILFVSAGNGLRVWRTDSLMDHITLNQEPHGILFKAAFGRKADQVISGGSDGRVRIWDVKSRRFDLAPAWDRNAPDRGGHRDVVHALALQNGGEIVASGARDNSVRIWTTMPLARRTTIQVPGPTNPPPYLYAMAYSPDGKRLAVAVSAEAPNPPTGAQQINLYETENYRTVGKLMGHKGVIQSLEFNNDGSRLVSGGEDGVVRLWDTRSGQQLAEFLGHQGTEASPKWVLAVRFTPDQRCIVSGGTDWALRVWDIESRQQLWEMKGHAGNVCSLCFIGDGRGGYDATRVVSGGGDGAVKIWSLTTGRLKLTLGGHTRAVWCVNSTPEGRLLSCGEDSTIRIWEIK